MRTLVPLLCWLALAACTSDAGDDPSVSDQDAESSQPEEEGGATDGAAAESRDLRLQLSAEPTTFSPLVSSIGVNHLLGQLHWDGLVATNARNEYAPQVAESWEVSEDAQTWTFTLREGLSWSDGTPLTSTDVLFSYTLYADPDSGSAYVGYFSEVIGAADFAAGEADSVAGFAAPDERTFVIELEEPNSALLEVLVTPTLFLLPEHVLGDLEPEELVDHEFFREPSVGLGPYVFERWVADDHIEFVANPHHRSEPAFDRVFAQQLTSDVALAQLETGELDLAVVSASDAARVDETDGVTLHRTEGPGATALFTPLESGKLTDRRVRQAILHAIDRESLIGEVFEGEGTVVDTPLVGPAWAVPHDLVHYDYDPGKARQLLEEADWDPTTEVRVEVVPGTRDNDIAVTIVAAQLQEVGIDAQVRQLELAQAGETVADRDFDLLISSSGNWVVDPAVMNVRLMCDQAPPHGINTAAYCNEELDELLRQGIRTTDRSERVEIYHQAQHIINEDVPYLLLYVRNTLAATSDRLQGFEINPQTTHLFGNADEWSWGG